MLIRTSKDKDHPYVMLNKKFLEDENLSLKAKGLLAYCMCKPDGWCFSIKQLENYLKEGRDSISSAFKELIKNGYCIRKQIKDQFSKRFGKCDYVLYESPVEIAKDEAEKPCAEKPYTGNPLPENPFPSHIYSNNIESNITSETQPNITYKSGRMSSHSLGRATFLFSKLKEINPKLLEPNLKKWEQELEKMISIDKRTDEEIKQVIEYIVKEHNSSTKDFTWSKAVQSPSKLREHFAAIWLQMKKPSNSKQTIPKQLSDKGFKNGNFYNGAECFVDATGISFQRGMEQKGLKFSEKGFWDQFDNILRKFNIRIQGK